MAVSARFGHAAALTGDGRPWITVQPFNQVVPAAGCVTLNVMAAGEPPLSFQWQCNGNPLPGATQATLTLTNVPLAAAGQYRCVVRNLLGSTTSQAVTLEVNRPPLVFKEFAPVSTPTGSALRIKLTGLSGAGPIVILCSTNLLNWIPVITNEPALGSRDFEVPWNESAQLFYRASEMP